MKAIAITATTGKRPRLLERCKFYVARQTVQVEHHIAEADADVLHNMRRLCDVFENSDADIAVVFEDDDWYAPTWVEKVLRVAEVYRNVAGYMPAGIGASKTAYYHVPTRQYWPREFLGGAMLAATAFTRQGLRDMRKATKTHEDKRRRWLIDVRFWKSINAKVFAPGDRPEVIGIKGLEPGCTRQHQAQPDNGQWIKDPDGETLSRMVGAADAEFYLNYQKG